jgi:hypothetical protein
MELSLLYRLAEEVAALQAVKIQPSAGDSHVASAGTLGRYRICREVPRAYKHSFVALVYRATCKTDIGASTRGLLIQ